MSGAARVGALGSLKELERQKLLARARALAVRFWGPSRYHILASDDFGAGGRYFEAVFHTSEGPDTFILGLRQDKDEGKWRIFDLARVPPKKRKSGPP